MAFDRINRIIPSSLRKSGLESATPENGVLKTFERMVSETLSDLPESSFKAIALSRGALTVSCRSSRAAYRLRAVQENLLYAIQRSYPSTPISRIIVMLSTWR